MNALKKFIYPQFGRILPDPLHTHFRKLTQDEEQSLHVMDFRDVGNKLGKLNNNVLLSCEHASNKTHSYNFPKSDRKFLNSDWAYDKGSREICRELAEKAKLLSLYANFSRLIVDLNRSLVSNTLIRTHVEENTALQINADTTVDCEDRLKRFYLPYYSVMRECLKFIQPRFLLSIHSFPPRDKDNMLRDYEVGIIFRKKGRLVNAIESAFQKGGVNYRLNEPYQIEEGVMFTIDIVTYWNCPSWVTECVLLEFRNDYCSNPNFRKKMANILAPMTAELKSLI